MLYGVECSTDLRCRNTKIKKFKSVESLRKWMENSGGFTHDDPVAARNTHHTFRYGYELKGRIDKKDSVFKAVGSTTYPTCYNDTLHTYLYLHATEIQL